MPSGPATASPLANSTRRALFSPRARRLWALLLASMVGFVLYAALVPTPRTPSLSWDKANHAAAFAALAFAGLFALRERPRHLFWISFGLMALGLGIELVQMQVPGRSAEGFDLLADAVGIGIGLTLATRLAQAFERRSHPRRPGAQTAVEPGRPQART